MEEDNSAQRGPKNCLVCGDQVLEGKKFRNYIYNRKDYYAHLECLQGLVGLLKQVDPAYSASPLSEKLIRNVDGKWILVYRSFPDQYIPILIFFALDPEKAKTKSELLEWLNLNDLENSNPKVYLNNLVKKNQLTIINKDKTDYFLITEIGLTELEQFIQRLEGEN